jgi:acetyltransferase-like isoleucine patch superfamily enzyme
MHSNLLWPGEYGRYIKLLSWRMIVPWRVRRKGVQVASSARFFGMPIVSLATSSSIIIGERCALASDSEYTALGVNHPIVLRTLRPNAAITVGSDTGISGASICAGIGVSIGERCLIGANVIIADTDFHPVDPADRRYCKNDHDIVAKPVIIEDNVFIGANTIVLKGVRIGQNSVVGAGSTVTRDVPPNSIVAGNPAHVIGDMSRFLSSKGIKPST